MREVKRIRTAPNVIARGLQREDGAARRGRAGQPDSAEIRMRPRRRQRFRRRRGDVCDPLRDDAHGGLIDHVLRERGHLEKLRGRREPLVQDRTRDIAGSDDVRARDAKRVAHETIHDGGVIERRLDARIPKRGRAARAMAVRAVCIEIGACALLDRGVRVVERRKLAQRRDRALVERRGKVTRVIPRSELVVRVPGLGEKMRAIALLRVHAEHAAARAIVADGAILSARIKPRLRARGAVGVRDRHILGHGIDDEISVGMIRAPFVTAAIDKTEVVAHEHARFEALSLRGIAVIHRQLEVFHEDGAVRKTPLACRREADFFPIRHPEPALLVRAIAPQRGVHLVAHKAGGRGEIRDVGKDAGGGKCERHLPRGRTGAREFVNMTAEARKLAEQQLAIRIVAERREAGVIAARVRPRAFRQRCERHFRRWSRGRVRGLVERPDDVRDVVAEDVFAHEFREGRAAIDVAADDRAAVAAVRVVDHRARVHADEWRREVAVVTLDRAPLKIQTALARLDHVHFLERAFAHIADEDALRHRVDRHAVRAAQAEREKFLERIRHADKGIVVRNEIGVRPVRPHFLGCALRRRVADGSAALVHIEAEHAAEQPAVDALIIPAVRVVAIGEIEEAVGGMKKHPAAIVPRTVFRLVDEHVFRSRIERAGGGLVSEACEPLELLAKGRPVIHVAENVVARQHAVIPKIDVVIRRELRMKRQPEQPFIVPALADRVEIEHQLFRRDCRRIVKRPNVALAPPHHELAGARQRQNAERVLEREIWKRDDRAPHARHRRRIQRQLAAIKRRECGARLQPIRRGRGGQRERKQREKNAQSAVEHPGKKCRGRRAVPADLSKRRSREVRSGEDQATVKQRTSTVFFSRRPPRSAFGPVAMGGAAAARVEMARVIARQPAALARNWRHVEAEGWLTELFSESVKRDGSLGLEAIGLHLLAGEGRGQCAVPRERDGFNVRLDVSHAMG